MELGLDLERNNHALYEKYLGVPEWLAKVEDVIFEGLPEERSKLWPVEFGEAINVGADLDQIRVPLIILILEQNIKTLDDLRVNKEHREAVKCIELSKKACQQMIEAQKSGDDKLIKSAESAAWSARSAARSAESAAWSARSAARSARSAAWSAESAAWSAESAESARSAARSARSAARSAESAAWSARSAAWSAESAAWSAESAAYERFADKLLELMRDCR